MAEGRLGAVLHAPTEHGLTRLGGNGPWLATTPEVAKRVLMEAASFDFPTNVSRGSDLSESSAETRTGHHIYTPLSAAQVERGRALFLAEWSEALNGISEFEAMDLLRRPIARATCVAVLGELEVVTRNEVADRVLAWIDALAPVISSRRNAGRWSMTRRREQRARAALDDLLTELLPGLGVHESAPLVATMLAAGIQVPIAAGSWLLVFLADHAVRGGADIDTDHAAWEALRLAPPTWMTARVSTARIDLGGKSVPAGEVVLVSPLLLGRLSALVPGDIAELASFLPERWGRDDIRPGAWLPFGAGAHACPGRTLGLGLLRDLARWSMTQQLSLTTSVTIDQSRGILPSPAHIWLATEGEQRR